MMSSEEEASLHILDPAQRQRLRLLSAFFASGEGRLTRELGGSDDAGTITSNKQQVSVLEPGDRAIIIAEVFAKRFVLQPCVAKTRVHHIRPQQLRHCATLKNYERAQHQWLLPPEYLFYWNEEASNLSWDRTKQPQHTPSTLESRISPHSHLEPLTRTFYRYFAFPAAFIAWSGITPSKNK